MWNRRFARQPARAIRVRCGLRTRIGIRGMDLVRRFPVLSRHRAGAISGPGKARQRARSALSRALARSGRLCVMEIGLLAGMIGNVRAASKTGMSTGPRLGQAHRAPLDSNQLNSNPKARNARLIAAVTSAKAVRRAHPGHPAQDRLVRDHLVRDHRAVTVREGVHRARRSGRSENVHSWLRVNSTPDSYSGSPDFPTTCKRPALRKVTAGKARRHHRYRTLYRNAPVRGRLPEGPDPGHEFRRGAYSANPRCA